MIHVICFRPGMHRGGRANPRHAAYPDSDITPHQLHDLVHDPEIVVIKGGDAVTPLDAEAALVTAQAAAKAAKAKG